MAGLPINFAVPSEATLNISYSDFASGSGFVDFYFVRCPMGRFLIDRNIKGASVDATDGNSYVAPSQTDVKATSCAFNLPRTVSKGYAFYQGKVQGDSAGTATVTMTIQKYDGSTYTNISAATDISLTVGSGPVYDFAGAIPISSEVIIKKGEYLIVNITTNSKADMYQNNATYTAYISIPFKIDR